MASRHYTRSIGTAAISLGILGITSNAFAGTGPASRPPGPPVRVTISQCKSGEADDSDIIETWTSGNVEWVLECYELKHIAKDHAPVTDSNGFLTCIARTFVHRSSSGDGNYPNSAKWIWNYHVPGRATAIVDKSDGLIYSFYTNVGGTHDWGTCASS